MSLKLKDYILSEAIEVV